jgi:DNA-binding NarL/FixJ family response regulator
MPIRSACIRRLSLVGFNAHSAPPTAEIAHTADSLRAHAIVTLLSGGETNGWRPIEVMRTEKAEGRVPVIVLADRDDPEIRTHAEALGCAAVLTIPCLPDQLAEVLRRVLFVEQVQ